MLGSFGFILTANEEVRITLCTLFATELESETPLLA
jgi:hypothetical protein